MLRFVKLCGNRPLFCLPEIYGFLLLRAMDVCTAQVDVGGGSCRKHGGGRRCGADGCMKTDVGGECLGVSEAWCLIRLLMLLVDEYQRTRLCFLSQYPCEECR